MSHDPQSLLDVAIVGAGLSGLICAQQLQRSGYRVGVIEKSRGLGGRLATRRLQGTCADHGVRLLEPQGCLSQALIQTLLTQGVLQSWPGRTLQVQQGRQGDLLQAEPYYAAPEGLTAVAKFLATDLQIWRGCRVQSLQVKSAQVGSDLQARSEQSIPGQKTTLPLSTGGFMPAADYWRLGLAATAQNPNAPTNAPDLTLMARSVVLAIPAPQAVELLSPLQTAGLPVTLVAALQSVTFAPCLTVIATYPAEFLAELATLPWQMAHWIDSPELDWISWEQTKRASPVPLAVVQSTPAFARTHLDSTELDAAGQSLLDQAAEQLPWMNSPLEKQTHRWRYARVEQPWEEPCWFSPLPLPILCSGDWCGQGQREQSIENALKSGLAAAAQTRQLLVEKTGGQNLEPRELQDWSGVGGDELACFQALLQQLADS